ncbi:hypothetical protein HYDPIDRAFT_32902 [Hydnomerulius pinastri MD-312]|uniref:Uncharacterized protein n=1 Tax=Hydnomerulius pinastri MD-312 TaxID=994086 RepID=A0A0C9W1D6_9AGAM|nr:hypothetical protein HYDPIDRAFT_32902 [Hydnomerulius pinastri MD-312]
MNDEPHPLVLELTSLRQTASRFQHEAHAAAIKLQRHSLETSRTYEHAAALEQENARLKEELEFLRENPDVAPHPAVVQVQELTLALRRVSEKIELTELTLRERTGELTHTRSELVKARHDADGAFELAARMRAREEEGKVRERELELKARASEEERKMVDLVVQEYADLVRSLEGRKSVNPVVSSPTSNRSASTITLVDSLHEGKSGLQKLFVEFTGETEQLEAVIAELRGQVSSLQATIEAERKSAFQDRTSLAQARTELDKLKLEDQTAAKMVSRYMKFSQSATNALQEQIIALKARHASTTSTLQLQLSIAESHLASERAQSSRLQDALDELCEDVVRETYGRRREVALRLALLAREEGVAESMRRWARRARELFARCYPPLSRDAPDASPPSTPRSSPNADIREAFHRVVSDAESLLRALDDDMEFSDGTQASGALARILVSREAVEALRVELQDEVGKRVDAIRRSGWVAHNEGADKHIPDTKEHLGVQGVRSVAEGGVQEAIPFTPSSGDAKNGRELIDDEPASQDVDSPLSLIRASQEAIDDDPFNSPVASRTPLTSAILIHDDLGQVGSDQTLTEPHSPGPGDGRSPVVPTLLVSDEESRPAQELSPAVSVLELQQTLQPPLAQEPVVTNVMPAAELVSPNDLVSESRPAPIERSTVSAPEVLNTITVPSIPIVPAAIPQSLGDTQQSQSHSTGTLLPSLNATRNRYDTLQRAFRDCSLALKELKRTLTPPSPSSGQNMSIIQQHLQTALSRIDDYAEDARVELEIRIADEELTAHGFETLLSIPGALSDPTEQAEVEENARGFIDGTDEGVSKALERFGKKLEDIQHDVAVIKRAVHELSSQDQEDSNDSDAKGAGWSAWTAGLLGSNSSPSRSATPGHTFGSVMTSPRLRHSPSLKQLHSPSSQTNGALERGGPLAGLELRIPMPSPLGTDYANLGIGRAPETRPRTISTMYSIGLGARSSSLVGLGSASPSPSRTKTTKSAISRFASAPRAGAATQNGVPQSDRGGNDSYDLHDHSDVE